MKRSLSVNLFDKIRSQFPSVEISDEDAKPTSNPDEAKFFNFDYQIDGNVFGNITISIVDSERLQIFYSRSLTEKIPQELKPRWYDFLKSLRFFAKRNLLDFDTHDITRARLQTRDVLAMKDFAATDNRSVVSESWEGNRHQSYQNYGGSRIIIKHSKLVNEESRGSRTRNIESIFVENAAGERFKMPFKSLMGSRVMCRHISEGGTPYDSFGLHITQLVKEMNELRSFLRYTNNRVFEHAQATEIIEACKKELDETFTKLHELKTKRGYKSYFGIWDGNNQDTEVFEDALDAKEIFSRKIYNEKIDSCFETAIKAYKKHSQLVQEYVKSFEDWADALTSKLEEVDEVDDENIDKWQDLFQNEIPYGYEADNVLVMLTDIGAEDDLKNFVMTLDLEQDQDVRPALYDWLEQNQPDIASQIDYDPDVQETIKRNNKQLDLIQDVEFDREDTKRYRNT